MLVFNVNTFTDGDDNGGLDICNYLDTECSNTVIEDGGQMVTLSSTINIVFNYPLNKPVMLEFHSKLGFTIQDVCRAVYEGYTLLYNTPGCGPWGLEFADLSLVSFHYSNNIILLEIDS
jgi:hypothetical protein